VHLGQRLCGAASARGSGSVGADGVNDSTDMDGAGVAGSLGGASGVGRAGSERGMGESAVGEDPARDASVAAEVTSQVTTPVLHGLPPVIDRSTRVVILGSFPGVASLRAGQYYAHPRNHFWPILGALWGVDLVSVPYDQRLDALLAHGLGVWDVYDSCQREGSLDSAIVEPRLNDLASLAQRAPGLRAVAHNGGESARAMRHTRALGVEVLRLPSTSPANASWSFERKLAAWRQALEPHLTE